MPIKEFIAVAAALMASIIAIHPTHPLEAVREIQAKILRDVGRTDNWLPRYFSSRASPTLRPQPSGRASTHLFRVPLLPLTEQII